MEFTTGELDHILDDLARLGWVLMRRFSTLYRPGDLIAAVVGLSRDEFAHLRSVHYLGSVDVRELVRQSSPSFIRSMPMASELAVNEDRSYPRGRTDWIRTCVARMRRGGDSSYFVSRTPQRSRDTTAARLFAHLLSDLAITAQRVLASHLPERNREEITQLRREALDQLSTLKARGVNPPRSARAADFSQLRRSTRADVQQARELFYTRQALYGAHGEARLRDIMASALFAPENVDDLFESWALLTIVELHLKAGWLLESVRLVGGRRKDRPHFTLKRQDETVDLYYQMVPGNLSSISSYKDLFSDYEIDVSMRRPDIIANVDANLYQGPLIIEVKRSSDRAYVADALYKVLGYLADYQNAFGASKPKALLIVIGGIGAPATYRDDANVWIVPKDRLTTLPLPY